MSSITKTAVYDARLMQDPPAYAVQKGALSVSVAPFNAVSATASSMVFQILVPSLNVFVDRKIQLKTSLNFSANLFYSGPRAVTSYVYRAITGNISCNTNTIAFATALNPLVPVGSIITMAGTAAIATAFRGVVTSCNAAGTLVTVDTILPYVSVASGVGMLIAQPSNFDAPDPIAGVRFDLSSDQYVSAINSTDSFQSLGYATACSSKDLSYCIFPVQSSLNNMTATLNDCTVTTNGDTLHEQILLTMTKDNVKQRTTPSSYDTFAWGKDDANNGSGNFSSYSITNSLGDIPNGAFPTIWMAGPAMTTPLSAIAAAQAPAGQGTITQGATAGYPFLAAGSTASFIASGAGGSSTYTGIGWYIAAPASSSVVGANSVNGGLTVVPFVDSQPVWTTAFPGGDLLCNTNPGVATSVSQTAGFDLVSQAATGNLAAGEYLTLLKNVPPFSMIGARLYVSANVAVGTPVVAVGFVSGLVSGGLGQIGSQYTFVTATAGGLTAIKSTLALQGGYQVTTTSMPVFGVASVVEPLVISPLIWADTAEFQTVGLYGMTNMQVVMNFASKLGTCQAIASGVSSSSLALQAEPYWVDDLAQLTSNTGNILRSSGIRTTISDLAFANVGLSGTGPWTNPALYVTFLTPGPDVTLPLVSTVPYVEFPRYVITQNVSAGTVGANQLSTNTISLTSIPDMIMLYVKPATKGPGQLDTYLPIKNVNVSFDNFSNLCSGFQQFNLYECAVAAGLDVDYQQFRGYAAAAANSYSRILPQTTAVANGNLTFKSQPVTQLSGMPLLLRMGHDITLSPGLAPGCLGNYSIQANFTVDNQYGFFDYVTSVTITLIAINTGFFETVRGQSAIRKTVLNSADVEAAVPESGLSRTQLTRMVGTGHYGRGFSAHAPTTAFSTSAGHRKDFSGMSSGSYGDGEGSKRARMGGSGLR